MSGPYTFALTSLSSFPVFMENQVKVKLQSLLYTIIIIEFNMLRWLFILWQLSSWASVKDQELPGALSVLARWVHDTRRPDHGCEKMIQILNYSSNLTVGDYSCSREVTGLPCEHMLMLNASRNLFLILRPNIRIELPSEGNTRVVDQASLFWKVESHHVKSI